MGPSSSHSSKSTEDSKSFDQKHDEENPTTLRNRWKRFEQWKVERAYIGWRFSLKIGITLAALVCCFNTSALVFALVSNNGIQNGRAVLLDGSCSTVRTHNTYLHLYINIAGTLLISASNYSMQCLSASTRHDIERAHSKKIWLDIGIQSFRNLKNIPWRQSILWGALAATSFLLHIL